MPNKEKKQKVSSEAGSESGVVKVKRCKTKTAAENSDMPNIVSRAAKKAAKTAAAKALSDAAAAAAAAAAADAFAEAVAVEESDDTESVHMSESSHITNSPLRMSPRKTTPGK